MSAANDSQMFEQMKRFADFGQRDSDLLAGLLLTAEPHLDGIVERFYDRIDETGETRLVVETHSSRARLSGTLGVWIRELLAGPHDDAYYVKRCRIGRMHVKIGLKPHYVFTALTILRVGLVEVATAEQAASLHRLMDIELAIINQVYWGDVTEALKRSERLATIGELGASLAHEIRNPLAAMQNSAFLLRQSAAKGGPPAGKYLGVLDTAIDECSRLVTSMLEFARSSKSSFCAISTPGLVRMAVVHARPPEGVTVNLEFGADAGSVLGDEVQLRGVIRNLITNAIQAMTAPELASSIPALEVTITTERAGSNVLIHVADEGPGISPEVHKMLFKPLATTKIYGLGLGLAYSQRVAVKHGGTLTAANRENGGAQFTLTVPSAEPSESATP